MSQIQANHSATISVQQIRGFYGVVGAPIDTIAEDAVKKLLEQEPQIQYHLQRQPQYHVTLLTKDELRAVPKDSFPLPDPENFSIVPAGVGGKWRGATKPAVLFVVVIWVAGQLFRKQLGLPSKQFHVTLSTEDDHEMDKSIESLLPGQPLPGVEVLEHYSLELFLANKFEKARQVSITLVQQSVHSSRGFLRLADTAFRLGQHKLAMLSYACAFQRAAEEKPRDYSLKKVIKCSEHTEWGLVIKEEEKAQIPDELFTLLFTPWSSELRTVITEAGVMPTLCMESREQLFIPYSSGYYKLPRFFRWLIPFQIALMSTPRNEADIDVLASPQLGIRQVLTLTEETPLERKWFSAKQIRNTFLPVPNYHPPSIEQMDIVMRLLQDETNLPVLIHCGGGKGRAGTVAACYLAAYGFKRPSPFQTHPELASNEAITALRTIRPGSIETERQEAFVSKWCSVIWKRGSVLEELVSEPSPCPYEVEGTLGDRHDLFVLVGLPGSGKSWFSRAVMARDPSGWTRISQDDAGGRATCETQIGRTPNGQVLLDRCNTSSEDRRNWLALAANWVANPVCVWFDYDPGLCISRAQNRPDHPTLPPGSRVRNAVEQMRRVFVQPKLAEGFKAIIIIRSFAAARDLVRRLSPPITLLKFPRTPHLLNLGAISSDDVLAELPPQSDDQNVVITEKIDGANMGFSLSGDDPPKIQTQNRSHYVNPGTHAQFKKLGLWIDRHRDGLLRVLNQDECFPQRFTLYGEWMFATHSIAYTHLPDHFVAFDVFDRSTGRWADRKTLERLLEGTEISLVPVIQEGKMPNEEALRHMVLQPSKFWDGPVEGVYVKFEKSGHVVSRGKVVRGDFIAGNEHWTRGPLRLNGLDPRTSV